MSKLSIIAVVALMLTLSMAALPASAEKVSIRGEAFDEAVGHVPAGSVTWSVANGRFEDTMVNTGCAVLITPGVDVWEYTGVPAGCPAAGVDLGIVWTTYNFAPFWYDLDSGQTSEVMRLAAVVNDANRGVVAHALTYRTSDRFVEFELSKGIPEGSVTVGNNAGGDASAIEHARWEVIAANDINIAGNQVCEPATEVCQVGYSKIGWLGSEYVALNGASNKLAKLLLEQGGSSSEKQTLQTGNTWTVGDWEIMINSIDARASPRKAWFTLSYKGQKLDDVVVEDQGAGRVYTYVESSIAGETDVPMFVTYVDSIFSGSTTDMVQFRYTWAISRDVQQIETDDDIGIWKVTNADATEIAMDNDNSITLTENSIVNLGGEMKFDIADDNAFLRFFPIVERNLGAGSNVTTPDGTSTATVKATPKANATTNATVASTTVKPVETTAAPTAAATTAAAAATPK